MTVSASKSVEIDKLRHYLRGLSEGKAGFQLECCVWCMTESGHKNGDLLRVLEGDQEEYYNVIWTRLINLDEVKSSVDQIEAAEYGAEVIALLVGILKTGFTVINKSRLRGGGYDYWLGTDEQELFQHSVRLEVSGIFEEKGSNTISARRKSKVGQVTPSDGDIPALIIIVEFTKFIASLEWKNATQPFS